MRAQSAARPRVRIEVDACVPVDAGETARLAAMELHAESVTTTDAATAVIVRCDADRVIMRVEDAATRKTIERAVRSADLGQRGAARLLALAISELVYASWAELNEPPPALEPADPPPPAPAVDAIRNALDERQTASSPPPSSSPPPIATRPIPHIPYVRPRFALTAFGRAFPAAAGNPMWLGARFDSGITLGNYGLVSLALGLAAASARADIGRIDGYLPDAALLGGVRFTSGHIEFRTQLGAHVGVALFQGVAATPILASPRLVAGAWFGPSLEVGLAYRANARLAFFGMFDAGYSAVGITARTRVIETSGIDHTAAPELGATGPWVTVGIGASFEP